MSNTNQLSFEDFLKKETSKRTLRWNDVSQWKPEQVHSLWMKAGQSLVGASFKDIDPKLTKNLILFILRDKDFEGDIDAGILLIGGNGTGKTVTMRILTMLMQYLHQKKTPMWTGKQMEAVMRLEEDEQKRIDLNKDLLSPTFFFDDLGEEQNEVKVYGTVMQIGKDVLTQRHAVFSDSGALTFATSNLSVKLIGDKYGSRVHSRCYEMFNVFLLEGEDMRMLTV